MELVRGAPWSISYLTQPGWPIFVLLAPDLQLRNEPLVRQPVLLPAANLTVLALLVADASGAATYQTNLPATAPLLHARLFVEAVAGTSLPLQTSPPLGGLLW